MRRILVTGANKGIGLAIAKAILAEEDDTFVLLGSRDRERGDSAVNGILAHRPEWSERLMSIELDVSRDGSVMRAARTVAESFGSSGCLYGVVNNAGVGNHAKTLEEVLEVNTAGVRRVCEAFLPQLDPARGRIVVVTSASGPSFVAQCSANMQRFFLDPHTDWYALTLLMQECIAIDGDERAFAECGLANGDAYGLSKACANTYMQHLAMQHPELRINACTPGFIATDLTRHYAANSGKSAAELGMKPPEEGARAPLFLLFGELEGNGRYYGSDAKRSPMDRYRSPGSPAYTGP